MSKKCIITVELSVDVDNWALAYGIDPEDVQADATGAIWAYKESDSVFAGAEDAPFKVRKVKTSRITG